MSCRLDSLYPLTTFDAALPQLAGLPTPQKTYLAVTALSAIHAYLGWAGESLVQARVNEPCNGIGMDTVYVSYGPIVQVHNVWLDSQRKLSTAPTDVTLAAPATSYRIARSGWGLLRVNDATGVFNDPFNGDSYGHTGLGGGATGLLYSRGQGSWPRGEGTIWIDYTYGYTSSTLPNAITAAVAELVSYGYRVTSQGGFLQSSVTYQDVSVGTTLVAQGLRDNGSLLNTRNLLSKAGLVRPPIYSVN